MNAERFFLVDGQLRPIWRFFLAVVLVFAAYVLAAEAVRLTAEALALNPGPWTTIFWGTVATCAAVLAAFKLLTRVFERRPLGSTGLALHSRWGREFAQGLAVGAAMILIAVVPEWAGGLAAFKLSSVPAPGPTLFVVVFLVVAASNEEIVFRGYPFQRLVESLGPVWAVVVTSVLFGVLHLGNPHHTWFSTANTALVGIPFALAYLRTRSLWMPIGMHFIWNFLMGFVLGLPVSGIIFPISLAQASCRGPAWLTGGDYGPEGGALATVAIVAGILYVLFSKRISMTQEMHDLVFSPVVRREPEPPITIFTAGSGAE